MILFAFFLLPYALLGQVEQPTNVTLPNIHLPEPHVADLSTWKSLEGVFISIGFASLSGIASGVKEASVHAYPSFKARHPNANDQFWNDDISHLNKWKGGVKENGPAYFGSTTFLVWTTDSYHMLNAIDRFSMISGALCFGLSAETFMPKASKFWRFVAGTIVVNGVRMLTFNATYHLFYGRPF